MDVLHIMKRKMGLLVMAYGTPYKEDDVERYYTHIRRGRKPTLEMLEDFAIDMKQLEGFHHLQKLPLNKRKNWKNI